jgi:hypothetical protein
MSKEPLILYTHELHTFAPSPAIFWMKFLKKNYRQFNKKVNEGIINVSKEYTEVFNQSETLGPLEDLIRHRFNIHYHQVT